MTKPGTISTNIRLGRLDYLIRWKRKDNPTKWKEIPPMKIPNSIPYPDIEEKHWKDDNETEQDFHDPASGQQYSLPTVIRMEQETEQGTAEDEPESPQATRGESWTPEPNLMDTGTKSTKVTMTGTISNDFKNTQNVTFTRAQ